MAERGNIVRAYIVSCASCPTTRHLYDPTGHDADKSEVERQIRRSGWSKTKHGWQCPQCVKRYGAPAVKKGTEVRP